MRHNCDGCESLPNSLLYHTTMSSESDELVSSDLYQSILQVCTNSKAAMWVLPRLVLQNLYLYIVVSVSWKLTILPHDGYLLQSTRLLTWQESYMQGLRLTHWRIWSKCSWILISFCFTLHLLNRYTDQEWELFEILMGLVPDFRKVILEFLEQPKQLKAFINLVSGWYMYMHVHICTYMLYLHYP